jgi:putative ABC transport system ATP-binding protein
MLDVDGLVKHYGTPAGEVVRAIDGVTLRIASQELVALYGPSGSGKTTLLKLIAAVLKPDAGSISLDGRVVTSLSDRAASHYRLHDVGFVLQSFHLLTGLSAIDNAALKLMATGLRAREAHRRVTPLLERLGVDERAEHLAHELSMGEQQRVAIAKALSTRPRLLLADEPTANLDSRRGHDVLALLADVCREQGAAVLVVTHDPQVASFADRVHVLRDGRLLEDQAAIADAVASHAATVRR